MSEEAERESVPTWAYKGDEARLFDHPDDVPAGWFDSPAKAADAPKRGRPPKATPEPEIEPEGDA